jgi:hypothetical protein
MTKQAYTTRKGVPQFRPVCTQDEIQEGTLGFCLACGTEVAGVEPDARQRPCEGCGAPNKVYGLEELFLMGLALIGDEEFAE